MARSRALIVTLLVTLILIPIFFLAAQFLIFGASSATPTTQVRDALTILCTIVLGMCILRHVRKVEKKVYALWESQQRFYEMLSHDLKSPISAILMSIDLLSIKDSGLNPRALSIIRRNATNMLSLVDSLLLSGFVKTGRLALQRQLFSVREVVSIVLGLLEPFILKKHISIVTGIESDLMCYADLERLKQILNNIIGNAIRYSPLGGMVTVRAYRGGNGVKAVHFEVRDNGPGIPKDKLEFIFEPYVRDHDNPVGHGLGLAIVRQLVNAHGGVVWADSVEGHGSRFYFKLPDEKRKRVELVYLAPDSPA